MLFKFTLLYFFFFSSRRRHTRSLRDWSSYVCSSDLGTGASWQELTGLPAGTVTLAPEPHGQAEALTARGSSFRAWTLNSGSWQVVQTVSVQIPYGSSG